MADLIRRNFFDGVQPCSTALQWAEAWQKLLLAQDGSATLICETLVDAKVQLDVLHQAETTNVPASVKAHLAGDRFIERQVVMSFEGQVMMDNLTYIALDGLDPKVKDHLENGTSPIGYIFNIKRTRKRAVSVMDDVLSGLWARCGQADPSSARTYVLEIENTSSMLITEVFRSGMRYGLPES
ncbi:MAG: chorismate--pyruvate lyase family protein [Planktomarina sp.]